MENSIGGKTPTRNDCVQNIIRQRDWNVRVVLGSVRNILIQNLIEKAFEGKASLTMDGQEIINRLKHKYRRKSRWTER